MSRLGRRLLALAVGGLLIAAAPAVAGAAPIEVAAGFEHRELRERVEVLRTGADLSLAEVRGRAGAFGPLDGQPTFGLTADTVWLRIMRDQTERALEARVAERTSELDDALQRLRQANEVLRQQSLSDSLTGLPNRRYFDAALERAWLTAAHEGKPVAVLMADIDHFKPINDRHGHAVGDEVLCAVAEALRGAVNRSNDVIARYGGEEFAALLPDSDAEGAWAVAERMRAAAAAIESPVAVTVSVGVFAAWPASSDSASEDAVDGADAALYRAKRAGRNRVAGPRAA